MTYTEFLNLTPRQFFNAVGGFIELEDRRLKEGWEQTRLIITQIANKPVYNYKITPKPAKLLLPFPWDTGGKIPTEEELKKLREETWPQGQ